MDLSYLALQEISGSQELVCSPSSQELQPLAEQIGDLRRMAALLARVFTDMSREQSRQTQMMQKQIELMEEMTEALRNSRTPQVVLAPAPPQLGGLPAGECQLQVPQTPRPEHEDALARAHYWFQDRVQKMGKSSR